MAQHSRSRSDGAEDKVRFAVVGQGHFAQSAILPAFASTRRCELVALLSDDDTKLRSLKRRYGVEYALSYDQMDGFLESGEVDAVYIALPNDLHAAYTERAARAGVHVLCEKPMAASSAQAERMISACARAGVKLMVAYRMHFEPANLSAIEIVRDGEIGEPRYFSTVFSQQVTPGNTRTRRARASGPLRDIGIYCINAARYLLRDEPQEAAAFAATRSGDRRFREIDEQVGALLRFPGDRLAQITCSFGASHHSSYTLVGTRGLLRLTPAYSMNEDLTLEVQVGDKTRRKVFKRRDQIAPELDEFAASILEDREPEPSGWEGLADMRVIEAVEAAARERDFVRVRPVFPRRRPTIRQRRRAPPHGQPALVNVRPPSQHH